MWISEKKEWQQSKYVVKTDVTVACKTRKKISLVQYFKVNFPVFRNFLQSYEWGI